MEVLCEIIIEYTNSGFHLQGLHLGLFIGFYNGSSIYHFALNKKELDKLNNVSYWNTLLRRVVFLTLLGKLLSKESKSYLSKVMNN